MKKILTILLLCTCLSCDKGIGGIAGFYLTEGCQPCVLDGTQWRWEGLSYNVQQAWTISFTSTTQCEMWWGNPTNYYQNKSVVGTYTIKGTTVTFSMSTTYSGTGSYSNKLFEGKVSGNKLTAEGLTYVKL
jgi:hypothetical protein